MSDKPLHPVGVSVLLLNRDGRVLLGERAANLSAGGLLSTPGGRIETNERIEETAARELEEETGARLAPSAFRTLGFKQHFRFDGHYFMVYVTATYDGPEARIENREPERCLGWHWWKIEEIPADRTTEPADILAIVGSMFQVDPSIVASLERKAEEIVYAVKWILGLRNVKVMAVAGPQAGQWTKSRVEPLEKLVRIQSAILTLPANLRTAVLDEAENRIQCTAAQAQIRNAPPRKPWE